MKIVLLSGDLMVVSRVEGAAKQVGTTVRVAANASQAAECCSADGAELLVVDLALASLDIQTLVTQLKDEKAVSTRVVAFGPHVHEERLAAARDAGCERVISRGQFFAEIGSVISGR